MRKWMRDKLKRRKKSEEEAATGPAPLQPAYFESEPQAKTTEQRTVETAGSGTPQDEPADDEAGVSAGSNGTDTTAGSASDPSDPNRRPRRRRRGGRGRRRPGQQSSSQQAAARSAAEVSGIADTPSTAADSASAPGPPAVPAPIPAAATAQRPSKGLVILAVGLPGSGKSSWFKRHNITPLSSDVLRSMLFDDPAEQRFQDLVFSNLRSMLKARLIARRPMNYVDATNLTPHERHNWIKLAKDFGYEVHAVFFDVPLEVCIERHQRRDRIVPEDVMRKMSAKLKAPTFDEGFAKITVVRVKQKEA
jgi:predicted kinase